MKPPCKGCTEREPLCHSKCEKYLAFRKDRDEFLIRKQEFLNGLYKSRNAESKKRKNLLEHKTGRRR